MTLKQKSSTQIHLLKVNYTDNETNSVKVSKHLLWKCNKTMFGHAT